MNYDTEIQALAENKTHSIDKIEEEMSNVQTPEPVLSPNLNVTPTKDDGTEVVQVE